MPVEKDGTQIGSADRKPTPPPTAKTDETEARQTLLRQVERVEQRFSSLHDDARFTSIQDDLEDISATVGALPERLARVRGRGYLYRSYLEQTMERLPKQWTETKLKVTYSISREADRLSTPMKQAEGQVLATRQRLSLPLAESQTRVAQVTTQVDNLESDVRAAGQTLRGMYDSLAEEVRDTAKQVADAEEMLDEIDAASFRLLPKEAPISMSEAEWIRNNEETKGLVFVTDHRLIFERKEEVVTKRRLLVFTEKKLVRDVGFEAPIGSVEDVAIQRVGTIFKKNILNLTLTAPPALLPRVSLAVKGDAEAWSGLVTRVITGDLDAAERVAVGEGEAEGEASQEPTVLKCSSCGSTLTVPIVKGMTSVTCEYCGNVLRL